MTDHPALRAVDISKDYGDGPALHPLTLSVAAGERVALIGHNGSGKTTFLRIAVGLLDADHGRVSLFGSSPDSIEARRRFSFLADTPTFYDDLSVWEHLEYVARLHGMQRWEQRASDLLGRLGLLDRADDLPARFSRGLRQKAAIALGLIRPFDLLLVDEPFVGLDAEGREALLVLFDESHRAGATLIVATHELAFVDSTDRTIALRDGTVIFDGDSSQARVRGLVSTEGTNTPRE
jgi:ABC-2 type transport system ATP-binding protein